MPKLGIKGEVKNLLKSDFMLYLVIFRLCSYIRMDGIESTKPNYIIIGILF